MIVFQTTLKINEHNYLTECVAAGFLTLLSYFHEYCYHKGIAAYKRIAQTQADFSHRNQRSNGLTKKQLSKVIKSISLLM